MEKETALIVVEKLNVPALFIDGGMDEIIEQIKTKATSFEPNIETVSGRKEIASIANKVARSKVLLDDLGKNLVYDWKQKAKKVDDVRKHMRDTLDALKERVRKPLTDWEKSEQERIDGYKLKISEIISFGNTNDDFGNPLSSETLKSNLTRLDAVQTTEELFGEVSGEAQRVKEKSAAKLMAAIDRQEKYEAEQAELEMLRKEKVERERVEYEERLKKEAADKAMKEAEEKAQREKAESEKREREAREAAERSEKARIAAEERAKRERIEAEERARIAQERAVKEAEERARLDAERKEKERLERERREREEAERKAANLKHREKIENNIVVSMDKIGVGPNTARLIIDAINSGKILHITINY